MGWTARESNTGGGEIFPPVQTGPGAHPAFCTMGTGSFPGVNCGRGVLLNTHTLLVPRSWKSRAIPLPTLWATTGPVTGLLYLFLPLVVTQVRSLVPWDVRCSRSVVTLLLVWKVMICFNTVCCHLSSPPRVWCGTSINASHFTCTAPFSQPI
jgi:hypothetical protein